MTCLMIVNHSFLPSVFRRSFPFGDGGILILRIFEVATIRPIVRSSAPVDQTLIMADFRAIEGVRFPFASEVYFDGNLFLTNTVSEITVNQTIDQGLFAEP